MLAHCLASALVAVGAISCGSTDPHDAFDHVRQGDTVYPDASSGTVDANSAPGDDANAAPGDDAAAAPGDDADAGDPNDAYVCVQPDASSGDDGGVSPNALTFSETSTCGGGQVPVPAVGNGHVCCKVRHCNDEGMENGCFLASVYQNDCQRWFHLPPPYPASTGVVADRDCVNTDLAASGCLFVALGGFPSDVTLVCGVPASAPRMPWGTVR
jgi:hypothetical protein